jgi:hypothetical protein
MIMIPIAAGLVLISAGLLWAGKQVVQKGLTWWRR